MKSKACLGSMRPWLEKTTKGATGFSNGTGLFPTLALGTFQNSGSKGGGPATKKGRKERGRAEIYTKGGGSKTTPSIPKLPPSVQKLCSTKAKSFIAQRRCQEYFQAHLTSTSGFFLHTLILFLNIMYLMQVIRARECVCVWLCVRLLV